MATPSPFEVARQTGNNLAKGFQDVRDTNAIDSILSQAIQSGDPMVLQDNISKILSQVSPDRQPQAIQLLENRYKAVQEQQKIAREQQAAKTAGYTYGAPPQVQAQEIKNKGAKENPKPVKETPNPFEKPAVERISKIISDAEHYAPLQTTLKDMKDLSKQFQGWTSYGSAFVPGTTANAATAQFEADSDLVLEPVFKLYNPAGALAQTKVTLLRDRLKPKWTDTQAVIDAKIGALEKLIEGKQKQADHYKDLIIKNNGKLNSQQLFGAETYDDDIINKIEKETQHLDNTLEKGMVRLYAPDGQPLNVPEAEVDELIKQGATR